ncbi:hypothetical protein A3F00_02030 [Candidatus Daviesbacteria bacterium RIFCSPHIGHO2_12_FULL_37_11]|uniref:Glycosyltransferase 2-like domain-containing protein n=1 Tax=Candidatus Daviesbacteria bacterium RIFCSPHIGHO2_12_FULL_37_11 TaxID=1797777 RepID=A0A1F5KF07_9BACT|nr:MAG: hypothetical protein A2769_03185 [Candidatus Daviesbacteria bacterium RIFCSPHIGHO2_01_FULL_37_27]OGE39390.1 MAG: hypothetical protein A3F00_02030 [Candidatus Daviesbacteria bacterium RIFCSPHIGHO2_12_FULL_37_11]OGE45037.1 MAG: hypothetical protein A3B39_05545 [Candidatus Daviesbacteria bacterium RIFCSPLOWO2_01_FULL_37_10]
MKGNNPLISVIITTKNSSVTLSTLLKSIQKQSYKKIEIIVVDNNSSDKTVEIAKKFTKKVFNKGPERSAQRNLGALKSKGKYLLFLDSDMELGKKVIEECVELSEKKGIEVIIIPEKTVGRGFIQTIRRFEREMYEGDSSIELARFYSKRVFVKARGFDENLTGPEDYDLFYRVMKVAKAGRVKSYIYHHEEDLTLIKLLQKKFYYAKRGALYAEKHPELIRTQGLILFRKVYFKNWKKFVRRPVTGISFIFVRILETIWAVAGYISAVGIVNFLKKLIVVIFPNTGKTHD